MKMSSKITLVSLQNSIYRKYLIHVKIIVIRFTTLKYYSMMT